MFEGRNKEYGAYQLRKSAGKRYGYALLITLGGVCVVAAAYVLLNAWGMWQRNLSYAQLEEMAKEETMRFAQLKAIDERKVEEKKIKKEGKERNTEAQCFTAPEISDSLTSDAFVVPKVIKRWGEEDGKELKGIYAKCKKEGTGTHEHNGEGLCMVSPREVVNHMPQFPGGMGELMKYLDRSIDYPQRLAHKRRVCQLSFIVDEYGGAKLIEIHPRLPERLEREIHRACTEMPKWMPAQKDGRIVTVRIVIPIVFEKGRER